MFEHHVPRVKASAQAASEVDPGLKAAGTGIEDLLAFLAENEGPGGW
jgi:hypothetical protein